MNMDMDIDMDLNNKEYFQTELHPGFNLYTVYTIYKCMYVRWTARIWNLRYKQRYLISISVNKERWDNKGREKFREEMGRIQYKIREIKKMKEMKEKIKNVMEKNEKKERRKSKGKRRW